MMIWWLSIASWDQSRVRRQDIIIILATLTFIWGYFRVIFIFIFWREMLSIVLIDPLIIIYYQRNLKWTELSLCLELFFDKWCFILTYFNNRRAALPKDYVFYFIFIFETSVYRILSGTLRGHRMSLGTKVWENREFSLIIWWLSRDWGNTRFFIRIL
jgi:hypothetical protein